MNCVAFCQRGREAWTHAHRKRASDDICETLHTRVCNDCTICDELRSSSMARIHHGAPCLFPFHRQARGSVENCPHPPSSEVPTPPPVPFVCSERERDDGSHGVTAVSTEMKKDAAAAVKGERNDGLRALKKKVLWSLERVAIKLFDSLGGHQEGEGPDDKKRHEDEKNMSDVGHALFNSVSIACIGAFLFGYHR